VSVCPTYLIPNLSEPRTCQNCKDTNTYFYNGSCISGTSCPKNTILADSNRNGCIECLSPNYFDPTTNSCVGTCPIYLTPITTSPRYCQNCLESNKYYDYDSNSCVTTCPEFLIPNGTTGICDNCKDTNKYSYNGSCYTGSNCPSSILVNSSRNGCQECSEPNYYNLGTDTCVAECPEYLIPNINSPRSCINCKDTSKLSYDGSCVSASTCPNKSFLVDTPTNGCLICETSYYDPNSKKCVTTCPTYLVPNTNTRNCDNCKDNGKYSYNRACLAKCPDGSFIDDTSKNGCKLCADQGNYFESGACVSQCTHGKAIINNICSVCPNPNNFISDFNCVDICPIGKTYYDSFRVCSSCPSDKYNYNNSCFNSCPTGTATYENDNNCFDWLALGKYLSSNYIVDKCPNGKYYDTKNVCTDCKPLFVLENNCVSSCPTNYLYDSSNVCYTCKSINKVFSINTCVTTCPLDAYYNDVQDISMNMCISCKAQNKYLVYGDKSCSQACPDTTNLNEEYSVCSKNGCLDIKMVLNENKCTTNCPDDKILKSSKCETRPPGK